MIYMYIYTHFLHKEVYIRTDMTTILMQLCITVLIFYYKVGPYQLYVGLQLHLKGL